MRKHMTRAELAPLRMVAYCVTRIEVVLPDPIVSNRYWLQTATTGSTKQQHCSLEFQV